ncbi:MAG: hypothetical protein EA398_11365 [Deltaproteobacteria bacterium]|nr:MAG: hypothetical protein EA398_11365 [Deltaproteobacteria bacterium]
MTLVARTAETRMDSMNNVQEDRWLEAARWADGEMNPQESASFEASLADDPELAAWASFVRDHGALTRMVFEHAADEAGLDGLAERVLARASRPAERSAELEMLAMAQAEGEPLTDEDAARVADYLERVPEARRAVEGLARLGSAHRTAVERVADEVDFDALEARILAAVGEQETTRTPSPNTRRAAAGGWSLGGLMHAWRGAFLGAAVTAAALLLVLPGVRDRGDTQVGPQVVHHHTYVLGNMPGTRIEQVDYQPGFTGTSQMPANGEGVPVIWFTEEDQEPDEDDLPL